jgi:hypothetical protein
LGDNAEIPSYRWWDKEAGLLVTFGSGSTFGKVADRYFAGCIPLTAGGACIAALYRAGATDRFGPAYEERHRPDERDAGGRAIAAFLLNPVTLYFWIRHGGLALFRIASEYLQARFSRRRTANVYVVADIYHEVLVHHLSQINFEDQVGGHGSIGGEQLHPFVLAKKAWGFDTSAVLDSSGLYPMLFSLRQLV